MKRILFTLLVLLCINFIGKAEPAEKLHYIVTYKWGLIHKDAGEVEITRQPKNDGYELKLIARTKPWADRIYKVRDTLISETFKELYRPKKYTIISHEKNKYKRDDIAFRYEGDKVMGDVERIREDKSGNITRKVNFLEGTGPTYDMLSVYFFLRTLDYSNMKAGENISATIFSGSKEEHLDVRCEGKENIQLRDKSEQEAWHIVFKFTQKGGKKSSDDINCWISTDPSHVPLLIVGNLPIGQVRVYFTR